MLYVLYFLAGIGTLFICVALIRYLGLKRLSVEFHERHELRQSSEIHLANDSDGSRPLLRERRIADDKLLDRP
jgi:hypothetical protein